MCVHACECVCVCGGGGGGLYLTGSGTYLNMGGEGESSFRPLDVVRVPITSRCAVFGLHLVRRHDRAPRSVHRCRQCVASEWYYQTSAPFSQKRCGRGEILKEEKSRDVC